MTRFIMTFTAPWCGPCKALKQAVLNFVPKDQLVMVNVDDQPEVAMRMRVTNVPTTLYFESGLEVARRTGGIDKEQTLRWLQEVTDDID